jgi:hypothetical protein
MSGRWQVTNLPDDPEAVLPGKGFMSLHGSAIIEAVSID